MREQIPGSRGRSPQMLFRRAVIGTAALAIICGLIVGFALRDWKNAAVVTIVGLGYVGFRVWLRRAEIRHNQK